VGVAHAPVASLRCCDASTGLSTGGTERRPRLGYDQPASQTLPARVKLVRNWTWAAAPARTERVKRGNGAPEFRFPHPVPPLSGRRVRDQGDERLMGMRPVLSFWRYADMSKGDRIVGCDRRASPSFASPAPTRAELSRTCFIALSIRGGPAARAHHLDVPPIGEVAAFWPDPKGIGLATHQERASENACMSSGELLAVAPHRRLS
jgi:hypothetical protein